MASAAGLVLTVVETDEGARVVPRLLSIETHPGSGRLVWQSGLERDGAWNRSTWTAWLAAQTLAGRTDADAHLRITGPERVNGGSVGLMFGLLSLDALLGVNEVPPFVATGAVTDTSGMVMGGAAIDIKAAAAREFGGQLEPRVTQFLVPPVYTSPANHELDVRPVTDVGSAYAIVRPEAYNAIAGRHRMARALAEAEWTLAGRTPTGYVIVESASPPEIPRMICGLPVVNVSRPHLTGVVRVSVCHARSVRWRGSVALEYPHLEELVRAALAAYSRG